MTDHAEAATAPTNTEAVPVPAPKTLAPPVPAATTLPSYPGSSAADPEGAGPSTTAPSGRRADRRRQAVKTSSTDTGAVLSAKNGTEAVAANPTAVIWRKWLAVTLSLGAIMGAAWFVLAPGGAIYGEGTDFATWFPRDATLAALMLVAGVLSAVLLLRQGGKNRRVWASATPMLALLVGGLAGSVLAWRIGVFAGDLFQTVPENLPSPSMIFSLRSPSVLLLWPLASAAVLFVVHFIGYYFARPLDGSTGHAPDLQQPSVVTVGVQQVEAR